MADRASRGESGCNRIRRLALLAPAGLISERPYGSMEACLLGPCGACLQLLVRCCMSKCCIKKTEFEGIFVDGAKYRQSEVDAYERFRATASRNVTTMLRVARGIPLWGNTVAFKQLAKSSIPVQFFWGVEDDVVPLDDARPIIRQLFPSAPWKFYSGCAHQILVEAWPQIADDIDNWLKPEIGEEEDEIDEDDPSPSIIRNQPPSGFMPVPKGFPKMYNPKRLQSSSSLATASLSLSQRDDPPGGYPPGYSIPAPVIYGQPTQPIIHHPTRPPPNQQPTYISYQQPPYPIYQQPTFPPPYQQQTFPPPYQQQTFAPSYK
eukprot:GHVL01039228.1.p1 GENE.GHVL01039228.1~~GHVL01039228.1.p1  ORF type:complete len:320 (+),score=61.17 GHVL01039228.1:503-1462(+)